MTWKDVVSQLGLGWAWVANIPVQLDLYSWWDYAVAAASIAVVAFAIYRLLLLVKDTRAMQLMKGFVALTALWGISNVLEMRLVKEIMNGLFNTGVIATTLVVIFQPELRRTLEQVGRGKLLNSPFSVLQEKDRSQVVEEVVRAMLAMAKERTGALIIMEGDTGLSDYVESGVRIDGLLSAEFLVNIFVPRTPLHDGAALVRGDRIVAAGCTLPLTANVVSDKELGMRHRAAIGITEESDALALVVSEETGSISWAREGKIHRHLDEKALRKMLVAFTAGEKPTVRPFKRWTRRVKGGR